MKKSRPTKDCRMCGKALFLRNTRDETRKRYCSRACRNRGTLMDNPQIHTAAKHAMNRPEINAKKGRPGETKWNWVPDRSKLKKRPLHEGRPWRMAVFERDNYTCQECGVRGAKLHAHHLKSYALFPELRWEISNGLTLCISCHKQTPNYAGRKCG